MGAASEITEPPVRRIPEQPNAPASNSFSGWGRDIRYAVRVLYKKPAFTLVALATLALGIGANTAIFSVVNAALLTPIPIPSPDQVVMVWTDRMGHGSMGYNASEPDFVDWQASGVFEKLAGDWTDGYNVLIGNTPVRVLGASVTQDWFAIGEVKPYLGRLFRAEDMQPGHERALILTYEFWNARFLADSSIIGKTTIVNGAPYTILGVLPKKLSKIANEEIYVPLLFTAPYNHLREMRVVSTVGRLSPGVSLAAAQSRMAALSARLAQQFPREDGGHRVRLQPIEEAYIEDVHSLVIVLFWAVGFVLLVACANIANLLLVRGAGRHRELAIRTALGAGRLAIMRQLLTESVLLSTAGGVLGIIPALLGIRLLAKYRPEALPNADLIGLNPSVLLFTLSLATLTGLLFGIIPAWNCWRSTSTSALRERSQTSGRELKFGNLFVVAEVALTVILAVAAGLMLRGFIHLRSTYPGYDPQIITMRVSLAGKQYAAPEEQIKFCRQVLDRLRDLAGVRSVAAVDVPPTSVDIQGGMLHFTDRPESANKQAVIVISPVTPDFFRTMHIPLLRGRSFTQADGAQEGPVLIIDQATANEYWPNRDPIGQYVRVRFNTPLRRIVGVAGTIERSLVMKIKTRIGQVYVPYEQSPSSDISLLISSQTTSTAFTSSLRREVAALAPDQPIYDLQTMDEARAAGQTAARFGTWLLGFFALLSLSLAAIGVYGVIAYTVEQRTREIGVRMALGATQQDLLFSILQRGLRLLLIGLVLGFCGALALGKLMGQLLHGISGTDPQAFLGAAMVLLLTGLLATYIPALRASRIAPTIALRHE